MSSPWIKVEKATARKPEVLRVAEILSIHPDQAFGLCVRFWFWCDDQMKDGHAPALSTGTLDTILGHAGFADALLSVGWLRVRGSSLEVPNFDRHLAESAKLRALSTERKRNLRTRKRDEKMSRVCPTENGTPLLSSFLDSVLDSSFRNEAFESSWNSWIKHRAEIKKPLKPTQVEKQLKAFAKIGCEAAIEMIEHTIAMGWQGLRPPDKPVSRSNGRQETADDRLARLRGKNGTR